MITNHSVLDDIERFHLGNTNKNNKLSSRVRRFYKKQDELIDCFEQLCDGDSQMASVNNLNFLRQKQRTEWLVRATVILNCVSQSFTFCRQSSSWIDRFLFDRVYWLLKSWQQFCLVHFRLFHRSLIQQLIQHQLVYYFGLFMLSNVKIPILILQVGRKRFRIRWYLDRWSRRSNTSWTDHYRYSICCDGLSVSTSDFSSDRISH